MGRCGSSCNADLFQFRGLVKHGSHKEHKGQLYKFRGLDGNSSNGKGKLRSKALIPSDPDRKKSQDPHRGVNPLEFINLPEPLHNPRDQPGNNGCPADNYKLL